MASKESKFNSGIAKLRKLRVAVLHDDLTVPHAGGEKIFYAIAELFPNADIFTSMATEEWIRRLGGRQVATSFMQKLPFKRKMQKAFFALYPLAFESFDFSDYDLVISSSTRFAHGVITKPGTKHICYMHSPGRMFWEPHQYFAEASNTRMSSNISMLGKILSPMLSYLRLWDYSAAQRVDRFIANSQNIKRKIKKYYGREAVVVNPFVDLERFFAQYSNNSNKKSRITSNGGEGEYLLIVTRLAPWKRVDIAIKAIDRLNTRINSNQGARMGSNGKGTRSARNARIGSNRGSNGSNKFRLVVVGGGSDRKRLETLANSKGCMVNGENTVEILGVVSDERLVELFRGCQAFIMTQEEDFGIAPLEAQACAKPVIAYGAGGALETVAKGKTGEFFYPQAPEALARKINRFDPKKYDPKDCRKQAEKFSRERFQQELVTAILELFE